MGIWVLIFYVVLYINAIIPFRGVAYMVIDTAVPYVINFVVHAVCESIYMYIRIQGVPGGNVSDFGRMFLTLKYTDITQNTYIRS